MADNQPIIVETGNKSSGASWLIAVALLLAVIAGILFFSQMSGSEAAKDNAVANAANSVGDAAKSVGDAADSVTNSDK